MVNVGDTVPDFELPDNEGKPRRLSEFLAAGPTVVFFYPKASSPVCTVQACQFRDLGAQFREIGAQRVGISRDSVSGQERFVNGQSLDFPLLADTDGNVAGLFGVKGGLGGITPVKRKTFVLDQDGKVLKVIHHELRGKAHADEALGFLKSLGASA